MAFLEALSALGVAHVTRFDVAVDFFGRDLGIVDSVVASCGRGELCGARLCDPRRPIRCNGDPVGNGVYLGKRGSDGSGRFIRVYDKGLESKTKPLGQWERWELECSGEVARSIAACMMYAWRMDGSPDVKHASLEFLTGWRRFGAEVALNAVDFRESNGRSELDRRPRCSWWAITREGIGESKPVRDTERKKSESPALAKMANFAIKCKWAERVLTAAFVSGLGAERVLRDLMVIGGEVTTSRLGDRFVGEYAEFAAGRVRDRRAGKRQIRGDHQEREAGKQLRREWREWLSGQRESALAGVPF